MVTGERIRLLDRVMAMASSSRPHTESARRSLARPRRDSLGPPHPVERSAPMNRFAQGLLVLSTALFIAVPARADDAAKAEKERKEIRGKAKQILGNLYKAEPSAKAVVHGGAGYAVFSSVGTKILIAGGGGGKGVAVDNKTHK